MRPSTEQSVSIELSNFSFLCHGTEGFFTFPRKPNWLFSAWLAPAHDELPFYRWTKLLGSILSHLKALYIIKTVKPFVENHQLFIAHSYLEYGVALFDLNRW